MPTLLPWDQRQAPFSFQGSSTATELPRGGVGPLMRAAYEDAPQTAEALLNIPGFVPNWLEKDEHGESLLWAWLRQRRNRSLHQPLEATPARVRVYRALLDAGVDPWEVRDDGLTPLRLAAQQGDAEFFSAYVQSSWVQHGWVEPPWQPEPPVWTPSAALAKNDRTLSVLNLLIKKNATYALNVLASSGLMPLNALDSDGRTPLHRVETAVCAKVLLEAGANPQALDAQGRSVRQALAALPAVEKTQALDAWVTSMTGSLLPEQRLREELLRTLFAALPAGGAFITLWRAQRKTTNVLATINEPSFDGRLLLVQAVQAENWSAVKTLIKDGADPLRQEIDGANAWSLIVRKTVGHALNRSIASTNLLPEMTVALLDRQLDALQRLPSPLDSKGRNPLDDGFAWHEKTSELTLFQQAGVAIAAGWHPATPYVKDWQASKALEEGLQTPQSLSVVIDSLAKTSFTHRPTWMGPALITQAMITAVPAFDLLADDLWGGLPVHLNITSTHPDAFGLRAGEGRTEATDLNVYTAMMPLLLNSAAYYNVSPLAWLTSAAALPTECRADLAAAIVKTPAFTDDDAHAAWRSKAPWLFNACEALVLAQASPTAPLVSNHERPRL